MRGKHRFVTSHSSLTTLTAIVVLDLAFTLAVAPAAQAQTFTVLHSFTYGGDGGRPAAGVTLDAAGNLYGTTSQGGSGHGTAFKLSYRGSGWVLSPLYSFTGGSDGGGPIARLVFGPDGSLYGTTQLGGRNCGSFGCGTIFNLRPPFHAPPNILAMWSETVLYRFSGDADGGNPGYGDVIFDRAGNLYGTTIYGGSTGQGVVYKLTPSNGSWTESVLYTFSGAGDGGNPDSGVVFDGSGNLYGTTWGVFNYGTVYQLKPSGPGWVENTLHDFQGGSDGANPLGGLTLDSAGNLYGATTSGGSNLGGTFFELSPAGNSWNYALLYSFAGSNGTRGPYGTLTKDAAGNLYGVTYSGGAHGQGNVFKLSQSGGGWTYTDLHDFAGGANDGAYPMGSVSLDSNGNLYGTASYGGTSGAGVVWQITP